MKRFSLRALLIATAVIAALLALPIRRAIVQKRGREWVASQNGHVSFSHEYNAISGQWDHDASLSAPGWLIDTLGIDFFDTVDTVVLDNMEVKDLSSDTDLQSLRQLANYLVDGGDWGALCLSCRSTKLRNGFPVQGSDRKLQVVSDSGLRP